MKNLIIMLSIAFISIFIGVIKEDWPNHAELPDDISEFEHTIFNEVNLIRVENGLNPTIWHELLYIKAQERCEVMSANRSLIHNDVYSPWSENLFGGWAAYGSYECDTVSPKSIVNTWLNSPMHRVAMLKDNIKHSAVAVKFDDNGFWVSWSFPRFGEPVGFSPWESPWELNSDGEIVPTQ